MSLFTSLLWLCSAAFRRRKAGTVSSLLLMLVFAPAWAAAPGVSPVFVAGPVETGVIAVIYPDLGEPYRSIFAQIIKGIEDKAHGRVFNFAVGAKVDAVELNASLHRQDARAVIALGRQGVKAAAALNGNVNIVVGGVLGVSENEAHRYQVNSLSPDPALLFSRLKGMMPRAKRVFTVYDPRQNEWIMRLAKNAARAHGLELVSYEANDLRGAMHAYQEILSIADARQDALWLPQDSTCVEESTVLPMVLRESWGHRLAVFSSHVSHVPRGVLFSLYPDNFALGRQLADTALGGGSDSHGIQPLREVKMAVNARTAKHLGLNATRQDRADLTYPEQ